MLPTNSLPLYRLQALPLLSLFCIYQELISGFSLYNEAKIYMIVKGQKGTKLSDDVSLGKLHSPSPVTLLRYHQG